MLYAHKARMTFSKKDTGLTSPVFLATVVTAGDDEVWRSTDMGTTYTQVTFPYANGGFIYDLVWCVDRWVAVLNTPVTGPLAYYSTNDGDTWVPTSFNGTNFHSWRALMVDKMTNTIFAQMFLFDGYYRTIKSTNHGVTWVTVSSTDTYHLNAVFDGQPKYNLNADYGKRRCVTTADSSLFSTLDHRIKGWRVGYGTSPLYLDSPLIATSNTFSFGHNGTTWLATRRYTINEISVYTGGPNNWSLCGTIPDITGGAPLIPVDDVSGWLAGGGTRVWRSLDNGVTWSKVTANIKPSMIRSKYS